MKITNEPFVLDLNCSESIGALVSLLIESRPVCVVPRLDGKTPDSGDHKEEYKISVHLSNGVQIHVCIHVGETMTTFENTFRKACKDMGMEIEGKTVSFRILCNGDVLDEPEGFHIVLTEELLEQMKTTGVTATLSHEYERIKTGDACSVKDWRGQEYWLICKESWYECFKDLADLVNEASEACLYIVYNDGVRIDFEAPGFYEENMYWPAEIEVLRTYKGIDELDFKLCAWTYYSEKVDLPSGLGDMVEGSNEYLHLLLECKEKRKVDRYVLAFTKTFKGSKAHPDSNVVTDITIVDLTVNQSGITGDVFLEQFKRDCGADLSNHEIPVTILAEFTDQYAGDDRQTKKYDGSPLGLNSACMKGEIFFERNEEKVIVADWTEFEGNDAEHPVGKFRTQLMASVHKDF
jgi:hypothetical protein